MADRMPIGVACISKNCDLRPLLANPVRSRTRMLLEVQDTLPNQPDEVNLRVGFSLTDLG